LSCSLVTKHQTNQSAWLQTCAYEREGQNTALDDVLIDLEDESCMQTRYGARGVATPLRNEPGRGSGLTDVERKAGGLRHNPS